MKMKYAICNETFVDWEHERAFAFARECGYTGIEIAPFTLAETAYAVPAALRTKIRNLARTNDLQMLGLHWLLAKTTGFHLTTDDASVRAKTADYLIALAELCRDVGGQLLVFGSPLQRNIPPGVTKEQATQNAIEVFSKLLPTLEQLQVTLAVEPLGPAEGNFLNTAAEAMVIVNRLASHWVKLHLDCKAMSTEQDSIPTLVHRHKNELIHFHANDPNKLGPGMGELDFVPILQSLAEINYRGFVSVEVFDYSPGPERLAKESINNLQQAESRLA